MKKSKTPVTLFILFLVVLSFSCEKFLKREIFIKASEIGIYYDPYLNEPVILNSGKHHVPSGISPNIYPIPDTIVERNVRITKKMKS